ncbi:DUF397 domain-containing protein [Streptomyces shenzhenensis]|uniref:DUF397 domain-containing protein n=1 Tax=Streptomyces shenzhenensis TaxID=943815 RepID=UPI0015F0B899|nr:DUF397 domain-containing protein [Streptomyces shenzhenensis]
MTPQRWQKSSYCQEGDACVHISTTSDSPTTVRIADAAPPRNVLTVGATAFAALLDLVKSATSTEGVELP